MIVPKNSIAGQTDKDKYKDNWNAFECVDWLGFTFKFIHS